MKLVDFWGFTGANKHFSDVFVKVPGFRVPCLKKNHLYKTYIFRKSRSEKAKPKNIIYIK